MALGPPSPSERWTFISSLLAPVQLQASGLDSLYHTLRSGRGLGRRKKPGLFLCCSWGWGRKGFIDPL